MGLLFQHTKLFTGNFLPLGQQVPSLWSVGTFTGLKCTFSNSDFLGLRKWLIRITLCIKHHRRVHAISTTLSNSKLVVQCSQGRYEGDKGGAIPRTPSHCGGHRMAAGFAKKSNNVTSTFFNTVHLLSFEHWGADLAFCSGRHLTSLRP